jgi:hypothetical protein
MDSEKLQILRELVNTANIAIFEYNRCLCEEGVSDKFNAATQASNNLMNAIIEWINKYTNGEYSILSVVEKYRRLINFDCVVVELQRLSLINYNTLKDTLTRDLNSH